MATASCLVAPSDTRVVARPLDVLAALAAKRRVVAAAARLPVEGHGDRGAAPAPDEPRLRAVDRVLCVTVKEPRGCSSCSRLNSPGMSLFGGPRGRVGRDRSGDNQVVATIAARAGCPCWPADAVTLLATMNVSLSPSVLPVRSPVGRESTSLRRLGLMTVASEGSCLIRLPLLVSDRRTSLGGRRD